MVMRIKDEPMKKNSDSHGAAYPSAPITPSHPVFADVFPIIRESHGCDQLRFRKSRSLLDGLIDQFDEFFFEFLEFFFRKKIPISDYHSEEIVLATNVLIAILANT